MLVERKVGEVENFRFAGGYATGARLPNIDGLEWIGDETSGLLVDTTGAMSPLEPKLIKQSRIEIIDEPPPFFRPVQMID